MVQSSITAWLKKPSSVTQPPQPPRPLPQPPLPSTPASSQLQAEQSISSSSVTGKPPNTPEQVPRTQEIAQHVPTPNPFALTPLPHNVEFVPVTQELMPAFKRLNALLLPIPYPQSYYNETLTEPHHSLTLMALWHSELAVESVSQPTEGQDESAENPVSPSKQGPRLIGAIRCRILPSATLYISTLGLLSPYRSFGIATHLLHTIAAKASREHGVKCVVAHVWEANDVGLEWYAKRGFEVIGKEDAYYRKLRPSGAILVRKSIGISDLLRINEVPTNEAH